MNPTVTHVKKAFGRVATRPTSIVIDRKGVPLPKGGHFQGIQRMPFKPGLLIITSSSDKYAYFVACEMKGNGRKGRASKPVKMASSPSKGIGFNHAGGFQAFGQFIAAGIENSDNETHSKVQFWDLAVSPPKKLPMTIARPGNSKAHTAGAVGLSSFGRGAVLAVASFNAATVEFYISDADPFSGSKLKKLFKWKEKKAKKKGWIDPNFGAYQTINLITQSNGQLFMVGFNRSGFSDWMDLFRVNLDGKRESALTKIAKKHMFCTDGCTFNAGSGIFIPSSKGFEVFAVNPSSGNHKTGSTIHVNHFRAK
jgi:hypothetical protein